MQRLAVLLGLSLLSACTTNGPGEAEPATACTEPRPQVCTMEYNPVCARLTDSTRKTYASACNACADTAVSGFDPEPCPEPG